MPLAALFNIILPIIFSVFETYHYAIAVELICVSSSSLAWIIFNCLDRLFSSLKFWEVWLSLNTYIWRRLCLLNIAWTFALYRPPIHMIPPEDISHNAIPGYCHSASEPYAFPTNAANPSCSFPFPILRSTVSVSCPDWCYRFISEIIPYLAICHQNERGKQESCETESYFH